MAPHVGMRHAHVRMHRSLATETTWSVGSPSIGTLTGRRDRIAFYLSVQLFLLFILSKLSRDRRYRTAPRMFKTFCQINSLGSRNRQTADVYAKSFPCHTCEIKGGGGNYG